ncbi:hypothetical protein RDWZM_003928 [Blomia tropicalis]|uniref:Uncharacterized protein n=1 Tax=Blomia tropicalis TaxID=40697 RepID=A0A9Q0RRB9_BLOTA|nr:hypothetical protein BLOT_013549 [Blomia tropicalis]KAJ6225383.1 hypothetical protein RDWZM_003928 [Blomia tropicalis]
MDRGNAFTCMKYTLILFNVFGFILAIFNALFGIGYPQEKWPGGYTGGQMAIFSLFVMAFTTIGYCGAQHHKGYLLIVYGIIIFLLLIGIVAICFIYNDSLSDLMYNGYVISFAVVIFFLMLFAFFISYKISEHGSNKYMSTIIPTAQQRRDTNLSGNCIDNRRHHMFNTTTAGAGTGLQGGGGANANPCPVPGCNYGKIISN